jgi:ligand-binding sensor domain-containing protein
MRKHILFYFLSLFTCLSKAQNPATKVYNAKNGLQGSAFNEIIQGKMGSLWIASDQGISKYNGYFFKNFASDEGIYDEHIASIKPHKKGYIWAISKRAHLFKISNDSVIPFENNRLLSRMVEHTAEVSSMAIDQGDTIWIGVKNADYYLKMVPRDGTYVIKKINFENKAFLKYVNNYYFYSINNRGSANYVLIEDDKGLFRFTFNSIIKHLSYCNTNHQNVISCNEYIFKDKDSIPIKFNDNINQVHIDAEDNVWLLFENTGLGKAELSNLKDLKTIIGNVDFLSFYRDYEGGTWLGSFDKGLFYIPSFNVLSILQKDGLSDEMITSIYKDLSNRIIAGSSNGKLFVIEKYKAKKILDLNLSRVTQNQILNIFQSNDQYYWVSCLHSAFRISNDFKKVTELKHNGKRLQNIKQFVQGKNATLWAGGENRLFSIHNSPEHITFTDYDIRFKINALATDKNFELWLGCNNGLWKFNERFFKY